MRLHPHPYGKGFLFQTFLYTTVKGFWTEGMNRSMHVCFEGTEQLPRGKYGTSIPLEWALNVTRDCMLAFEMNGEKLEPDHGFPIRLILPCVG